MADIYGHVNQTAKLHSSLPRVKLPANEAAFKGLSNQNLGATSEVLTPDKAPPMVVVAGQPSLKLQLRTGGDGVAVSVTRNSPYTPFISAGDMAGVKRIGQQMLDKQVQLSQGSLSPTDLRQRNHPYGLGIFGPNKKRRRGVGRTTRQRGVSNMAVVNRQSGEFHRSWELKFIRGTNGITIMMINTSKQAEYLAFGTKRMRAHGPFTTAPLLLMHALNAEWMRAAKQGYHRAMALRGFK
jgi:hypothetical protein